MVQSPLLAVALAASVHEGQPSRSSHLEEAALELEEELVWGAVASVTRRGDGVPIADESDRVCD